MSSTQIRRASPSVLRPRRDLLHDRDGALAHERDGYGLGARRGARSKRRHGKRSGSGV